MHDPAGAHSGAPDRPVSVPSGILCVGCAYDLGGLKSDGACPECGGSIEDALAGDHLSRADAEWRRVVLHGLRTCARGHKLLGSAILTLLVTVAVSILLSVTCLGILTMLSGVVLFVAVCAGVYAAILLSVGGWSLSQLEPRVRVAGTPPLWWVVGRWGGPAVLALAAVALFLSQIVPGPLRAPFVSAMSWALLACVVAASASWLVIASELARRTNGARIAARCMGLARRMVAWTGGAAALGLSGEVAIALDGGSGSQTDLLLHGWLGGLMFFTVIGVLIAVARAGTRIQEIDRHVSLVIGVNTQPGSGFFGRLGL